MTIVYTHYGTTVEAIDYFANRLHEVAWSSATPADRNKALIAGTRIIDLLNFKGHKNPVHALFESDSSATQEAIEDANLTQALEFPRGTDTLVPDTIKCACFEIAYSLLDGKDPELELENLSVVSQRYAGVSTSYNRNSVPIEHLINLVPSSLAWSWLRPFLRSAEAIKLDRVS